MKTKQAKVTSSQPTVTRAKTSKICVEIEGVSSLIQNNFSQKALEQMLKKHMGISVVRETKKPREVLEAATTRNVNGVVCISPTSIKKGMLSAAGMIKNFTKTNLRIAMFVEGKSIPIEYEEMVPRMDMVRTSGMARTPDIRFRPEFTNWKAKFVIEFSSDFIDVDSVLDLLDRAGRVGAGEWRPEKGGTFGVYKFARPITDPKEIKKVVEGCSVPLVSLRIPPWAMDADIDPKLLQRIASADNVSDADDAHRESEDSQVG